MLDKNNRKWKDLVTGKISLQTENFGLQMFLKSAATKLAANSATPADLEKLVVDVHSFFLKYERVLQKEIAVISK